MSQYIRGLVKSQSVLVNCNSFLWFQELEILLSIYHRPWIRWFIAKAAWFPGNMRQKQKEIVAISFLALSMKSTISKKSVRKEGLSLPAAI